MTNQAQRASKLSNEIKTMLDHGEIDGDDWDAKIPVLIENAIADQTVLITNLAAQLERLRDGLQWRIDNDPPDLVDECDHEELEATNAVLALFEHYMVDQT